MAFFMNAANMMIEVHVLLVANDVVTLLETTKLLEFNSYKVTAVRVAAIASSLLAKDQKVKYDVVMVDVSSSSDVQGFQLAYDAINFGYTVILMSNNPNPMLVKCAIEDGAFMFIQKPASMEVLKYLWQHVLRENTRKNKENGILREMESSNFILNSGRNNIEPNIVNVHQQLGSSNYMVYRNRGLEAFNFGSEGHDVDTVDCRRKKPKLCTEWTQELHEKFVDAIKELGDGRCFPRDILELMNVPGLKRMQVASHLQKCRQGWRQDGSVASTSNDIPRAKRRGSYPRVAKGAQPKFLVRNNEKDEQAPPTNVIEDSIPSLEPADNMIGQNNAISDHASNNISNENETISRDNISSVEMVVVESNHEAGRTINPADEFNFARDHFDGSFLNHMDYNFEGFDLDRMFSQNIFGEDEETEAFGVHSFRISKY